MTISHLEIARLAAFLDPGEHTARKLGEVVHWHLLVKRLEKWVHEHLEHLELFVKILVPSPSWKPSYLKLCLISDQIFRNLWRSHVSSHKLLVIGSHDLKCYNLKTCLDAWFCCTISTSFLKLVRSFSCDFFCFERCWMKSMDFCSTTALLTLWPEASVCKRRKVDQGLLTKREPTGSNLGARWHKLLESVVTLLDCIAPLLLCGSVRLPSPLPVRLTVLGVAVAVVICAWLSLETLEFPQGSI